MPRLFRAIRTLRIDLLALTVPFAFVWATTSHSGGLVMVVTFALLVLLFALSFDLSLLSIGMDPRVSIARDRFQYNVELLERARGLTLSAVIIAALVLLFVQWGLAVFALLAAATTVVLLRNGAGRSGARRLFLAEWLWPLAMLIVPMGIIWLWQWSDRQAGGGSAGAPPLDAPAFAATILGALLLAAFILASLMHSEQADRASGLRTTPAVAGRTTAEAVLFLVLSAAVLLAIAGVSAGWWGFWPAALTAASALLALWSIGHRIDSIAPAIWWIGAAATGILVSASVVRAPMQAQIPDVISDLIRNPAPDTRPPSP